MGLNKLERISRRKFIKLGLATLGMLGLPTLFELEKIFGPEGNPAQVIDIFSSLAAQVATHPSSPEHSQLLKSWLTLNGAIIYGQDNHMPVSSLMLKHYLYGHGQSIEFSPYLKYISQNSSPQEFSQPHFWDNWVKDLTAAPPISPPSIHQINSEYHIRRTVTPTSLDLIGSLGKFGLDFQSPSIQLHSKSLTLLPPLSFSIYDTFDFTTPNAAGFTVNLSESISKFIKHLNLPPAIDPSLFIPQIDLSATTTQGFTVEKYGYGHPFKIYSNPIPLTQTIELSLN